jgi:hypothetical protein
LLSLNGKLITSNALSATFNFSDHTEGTRYISSPLRSHLTTVYKYSTFTMATWQENSAFKSGLARLALGVLLVLVAPQGFAKPAPWYWWASHVTNHRVCAQSAPGADWFRESVAFKDGACSIRVRPF